MSVLVSVCPEDLENGVSKLPPNHTTLMGTSPRPVFSFFSIVGLKDCAQQAFKGIAFNPTRYKNLYE